MDSDVNLGQMEQSTRGIGMMIRYKDKEDLFMLTKTSTRANSLQVKLMVMVNILRKVVRFTRAFWKTTNLMERAN